MAATIPDMSRTVSFGPISEDSLPSQNQRSQSVVSIELLNENGEYDMVEIDEVDDVLEDPADSQIGSRGGESYFITHHLCLLSEISVKSFLIAADN